MGVLDQFRCMMGTRTGDSPKSDVVHCLDTSLPSYNHQEVTQVPGRQLYDWNWFRDSV